jgi:hypothetical protein
VCKNWMKVFVKMTTIKIKFYIFCKNVFSK